jgi:hypothetical protein
MGNILRKKRLTTIVHILQLLVLLIVPLIDWQQTFRYNLILFTPSSYHEDAFSVIAAIEGTENLPRPTMSASYVTASLRRYE